MKLPIYEELKTEIINCDKCGLGFNCIGENQHVVGGGNLNSKVMFIAESAGENEVKHKEPLTISGRSGKQFNNILETLDLKREDVYVCNLLVCHPPNNRDPEVFEIEMCSGFLDKQIKLVSPKLIVSFGRYAGQYLLGPIKITRDHGKLRRSMKFNIDVFPLYHPAYVSAYSSQIARQDFKNDIKTLKRIVDDL